MGFNETARNLIKACISTSSFSTLVEGSPTIIFKPKRGVRQGDSLSPLLFTMVVELLNHQTMQAINKGKLELFTMHGNVVESHLSYANDITFFCRARNSSFQTLQSILDEFADFVGLEINCNKSYVVYSASVANKIG